METGTKTRAVDTAYSQWRFLSLAALGLALALLFLLWLAPAAEAASLYILEDDATGGDCTLIGAWNDATNTCTLNTDIAVLFAGDTGIEIVDSGLTLDGNDHKITGPGATFPPPSPGVWVPEYAVVLTGVTNTEVRNLAVDNIDEGIFLDGGSANLIIANDIHNVTRGVIPVFSNSNKVTNNICGNALWTCVDVAASNLNEVQGNTITAAGEWGIRLFEGDNNTVSGNSISNAGTPLAGLGYGIWIFYGDNNDIKANTFTDMNYGVNATAGTGNQVFSNHFAGNVVQAEDAGGNFWNLALPVGGNLWDDFDEPAEGCLDADTNGFCDAPYVFTGNQDNLPLVGSPQLQLGFVSIYWASYAAYLDRHLSVDYSLAATGAVEARNTLVLGTVNTNGVTDASTLPVVLGDIRPATSAPFTLVYLVPPGTASFRSTVYLTAENAAGNLYEYPGSFPGP